MIDATRFRLLSALRELWVVSRREKASIGGRERIEPGSRRRFGTRLR